MVRGKWLGWVCCSLFSYIDSIPTHKKLFAVGKSGPIATFNLFFLGLGWPCVGEFDGFIIIFACFPTQQNLVYRQHTTTHRLRMRCMSRRMTPNSSIRRWHPTVVHTRTLQPTIKRTFVVRCTYQVDVHQVRTYQVCVICPYQSWSSGVRLEARFVPVICMNQTNWLHTLILLL